MRPWHAFVVLVSLVILQTARVGPARAQGLVEYALVLVYQLEGEASAEIMPDGTLRIGGMRSSSDLVHFYPGAG